MKEISEVLDPRCIRTQMEARSKREAIAELIDALAAVGAVADAAAIEEAVLAREAMASTGIGDGVAVPHALIPGLPRTAVAVGRSSKGIDFDAPDREPVRLVLLIIGPKGEERSHLMLLSRLARVLRDEAVRRRLLEAETAQEIAATLAGAG